MATTAGKTPTKPPNDVKKETSPVKQDSKDRNSKEKAADTKTEDQNDKKNDQHRENRHQQNRGNQNRRGGRFMPQNHRGGYRGGHQGGGRDNFNRDGQRGDNSNQFHGHDGMSGDFMGEQNDGPKEQKKFTGRCRLFVGNITPDTTEEQFKEMFTPFGEVSELFVNAARGFGFIRLDYRINAEKAKMELDGQMRNNRVLRVRFATHGAALKVSNLSPFVSNELLENAFNQFGEVERAIVTVDDRGRSCGEGIVEFARKPGATAAIKRINEGVFLLSSYPRPLRVEPMEQKDEEDGLTEKFVQRNEGFRKDREKEPRFAPPGTFEFEFGMKYRRIDDMEKEKLDRVKQEMELERTRLVEEMETAVFDYQADQIRQDLLRQQEELKRLDEMKNEHMRRRQEMDMRRQEQMRQSGDSMMRQEEERRREMMMRASNTMNREMSRDMGRDMGRDMNRDIGRDMGRDLSRDREGGQAGPGSNRGSGRADELSRGGPPSGMRESPQRAGSGGNQRGSGPGTPPMPPPPVPPGMNMDQNRSGNNNMDTDRRFGGNIGGGSPGNDRNDRPTQGIPGNMKSEQMQRPGLPGQQAGRFQGPPGQGNFPQGMGGGPGGPRGNIFQKMPPGGMGNNQNMGGNDRARDGGRRDDFDNIKRMRRY